MRGTEYKKNNYCERKFAERILQLMQLEQFKLVKMDCPFFSKIHTQLQLDAQ